MISRLKTRKVNLLLLLTAGALSLSGCQQDHQQPSPRVDRPAVTSEVIKPRIVDDGTVFVLQEQHVTHIGTPGVFILADNGLARFRMVRTGKKDGQWIEITSGLVGNEPVLKGSLESILDGSPVTVNNE
jgi:hypothetical protein